jgi:hypothetical protein
MTSATGSTRISKTAGFLLAGGVFGAAAAGAAATSVAPAPAQALDACFSLALTGTPKTGGASCSSVDGDASYFNVATAAAGGYAQRATR